MKSFTVQPKTDSNQGIFIYRLVLALIMMICLSYATFANTGKKSPYNDSVVEFRSFELEKGNGTVTVKWAVDHEENVSHYIIEKSRDGKDFQPVAYMFPKELQVRSNDYQFTEKKLTGRSAVTYRIVSVHRNGISASSQLKKLN